MGVNAETLTNPHHAPSDLHERRNMIDMSDKYLEHFDKAEELLAEMDGQAAAGIHALLALAVAVDRLRATYDGWQNLR